MKRAIRSIHIQQHRPRHPNRKRYSAGNGAIGNLQKGQLSVWKPHKRPLSSITLDHGGDKKNTTTSNSRAGNPLARCERRDKHRQLQQQVQRYLGTRSPTRGDHNRSVFATIHDAQDAMQDLLDRLVKLDQEDRNRNGIGITPITVQSLAWKDDEEDNNDGFHCDYAIWKERTSVFHEAGEFFDALMRSVHQGLLSPSRKHGKELAQLAECLLYVCSQQQPIHLHDNDNDNDEPYHPNNTASVLDSDEVMGAIAQVLQVLEVDWNLDVSHRHYEQAILAACHWKEWEVASDLFEKQIDPNAGGSPVRLSVENPLALYAMTRKYRQQQQQSDNVDTDASVGGVAEQIMDAVQRLVMVSPQDQDTYVLAAGNALGYAGCWNELNDYRKSSLASSKSYGTPLVAACLRACVLNGEYEVALEILVEERILSPSMLSSVELQGSRGGSEGIIEDPFSSNIHSSSNNSNLEEEWQWGGARDRMDPLIRDLAMQVIGGASTLLLNSDASGNNSSSNSTNEEQNIQLKIFDFCNSKLALELFRESLEEGVTISQDALLGVAEACERDKDWRGGFSVLRRILEEEERRMEGNNTLAPWIVSSDGLSIAERDQLGAAVAVASDIYQDATILPNLGPVLASVMRNCNSSSNFGLALFAQRLFRTQLLLSCESDKHDNGNDDAVDVEIECLEDEIIQMLSKLNNVGYPHGHEELLIANMVALSGLRCHQNSINLYERMTTDLVMVGGDTFDAPTSSSASLLYQIALRNQKRHGTSVLGNPWSSAHHHLDRLTQAGLLVREILTVSDGLQERQREGTEELLARAMNSCTMAHQPQLSLYLLEWMEGSVYSRRSRQDQDRDEQSLWTTTRNHHHHHDAIMGASDFEELGYGDSVTAETILALRWTKDLTGAIEIFEGILEKHAQDDLVHWRKTIVAGLTAMVANGRGNDAFQVFGVLDGNARSTASYTAIGQHLSKVKDWKELIRLYRDATADGYSSEELSLLAMLAVTSTKVDNRLRVLRAIVDECATSVGLDSKRWTMTKYWELKRTLGFYHARLLLWWNDEGRAPLDEVNLAIKEFYKERADGMRPKNDVVRAIVHGAIQHANLGLDDLQGGYEKVPRSIEEWSSLVSEILEAVGESPVRYEPNFVDSVVKAYLSLGKLNHHKECLDYFVEVLEVEGTRIKRSTLEDVLEIAKAEDIQALDLCRDIETILLAKEQRAASASMSTASNRGGGGNDIAHRIA